MNYLEELNPDQRAAVEHGEGPLLVFAGAGSGKTRVITYRVAHLIRAYGIPASRILAVTFTNKAAEEMKARLERLLGEEVQGLWVGTFHATCVRFLRESGAVSGISPNFVVYDEHDQLELIRQCLRELNYDEKQFSPRSLLYSISRAKERLIAPEEFEKRAYDFFDRIVSAVYPRYQQALRQANAFDFDDLLMETIRLFEEHPLVLERYQTRFLHLLVDEYQDVNFAQYVLVQMLAAKHRNLCVVGDDDQSIYSFRGAEVDLILRFPKDYPDAKIVTLERNYRSTQMILDTAFQVISQNRFRAPKRLWTERAEGLPVTLTSVEDEQDEARLVAEYIQRQVARGERRYRDFAVLYRTNAQSRPFEEQFLHYRIPHRVVGSVRFYDRKEVKDVLAYLRLLVNPHDILSLRRVINTPPRGIGSQTLLQIEQYALMHATSLWDAMRSEEFIVQLASRPAKSLKAFVELIEGLREYSHSARITELLRRLLEKTGYLTWLQAEGSYEAQERLENLDQLVDVAAQFEEQFPDQSLLGFLQQTALVSEMDMLGVGGDQVLLMTLHTAKGLEFPVVFLVGLEEELLPHVRSHTPDQIEEERRLCYVGMTRAKDELHLLYARSRRFFGTFRRRLPSPFLKAVPTDRMSSLLTLIFGAFAAQSEDDRRAGRREAWEQPVLYLPGQKVRHPQFGLGVVIKSEPASQGDAYVTVMFPGTIGMKRLLASVARLEAV